MFLLVEKVWCVVGLFFEALWAFFSMGSCVSPSPRTAACSPIHMLLAPFKGAGGVGTSEAGEGGAKGNFSLPIRT